jgi:hypothetical protein
MAKRLTPDQMALDVESVVNSCMGGEKSLGRGLRLEPLLLAVNLLGRTPFLGHRYRKARLPV